MKLKDLAIDHPYYASDSNFYSNEPGCTYDTFADFYSDFKDSDIDMNLVYRWDISMKEHGEYADMSVFMIQQRKGIYKPIWIRIVTESDVPNIIEFLKPHLQKLNDLWKPLS